jgi:hypothetical protein
MNRKHFLQQVTLGSGSLLALPYLLQGQNTATKSLPIDPLPAEKVKAFVSAGHNNLAKVKEMVAEHPNLVYATWDLGGGDFETALEGAGHVGNKEIANYLIGMGARTNLFVLAMLGKSEIVKPFIEAFPSYLYAKGPHGFSLLHHAIRGGEEAKELKEYFESKGLKEARFSL